MSAAATRKRKVIGRLFTRARTNAGRKYTCMEIRREEVQETAHDRYPDKIVAEDLAGPAADVYALCVEQQWEPKVIFDLAKAHTGDGLLMVVTFPPLAESKGGKKPPKKS